MTSTGAIPQPSIAAGEAIGDRSWSTSRKDAAGDAGDGFPDLLSRLAGTRERADREAPRDVRSGDGDRRKVAGWLRGNAEALCREERADDPETPASEPAQNDNSTAALSADDVSSLLQSLGANGALTATGSPDAVAARAASGTAHDAETALARAALVRAALTAEGDGEALSPEQLVLATPANAASRAGQPLGDGAKAATVTLTVLQRETHLAPVANAATAWAAGGDRSLRASAPPGVDASGEVAPPASGNAMERSADAQLAAPHAAVTAVRNAQLSADGRPGASPMAGLRAAADAPSDAPSDGGDAAAAADPALPVSRAQALVNAGSGFGPLQQLADRIAADAGTGAARSVRSEAPGLVPGPPFGAAVKVLHIQLQPADLGIVTVRLSLREQALHLDLEVGSGETARLIQREREALSGLLRSAGYLVDGLEVKVVDLAGAPAGGSPSGMPMLAGGQPGSSQADARPQGARPQDERQGNALGGERNGEDEQAGHAPRRGDIYV